MLNPAEVARQLTTLRDQVNELSALVANLSCGVETHQERICGLEWSTSFLPVIYGREAFYAATSLCAIARRSEHAGFTALRSQLLSDVEEVKKFRRLVTIYENQRRDENFTQLIDLFWAGSRYPPPGLGEIYTLITDAIHENLFC